MNENPTRLPRPVDMDVPTGTIVCDESGSMVREVRPIPIGRPAAVADRGNVTQADIMKLVNEYARCSDFTKTIECSRLIRAALTAAGMKE